MSKHSGNSPFTFSVVGIKTLVYTVTIELQGHQETRVTSLNVSFRQSTIQNTRFTVH